MPCPGCLLIQAPLIQLWQNLFPDSWIKDGIGDILARNYQCEETVRDLIENCSLPENYETLYGMEIQRAEEEDLFMRYYFM